MTLKMGDRVIPKNDKSGLTFVITEFSGEKAILKGIRIPVITVIDVNNLIKVSKNRGNNKSGLKRIK